MEEYEIERSRWPEIRQQVLVWGGIFIAIIVMRILYTALSPLVVDVYRFLNTGWMARVNFVIGVGGIGFGLYYMRKHARLPYGACEVAFGLLSAWILVQHTDQANLRVDLIALMGVLYLIVRGFDNCEIGMDERKKVEESAMLK